MSAALTDVLIDDKSFAKPVPRSAATGGSTTSGSLPPDPESQQIMSNSKLPKSKRNVIHEGNPRVSDRFPRVFSMSGAAMLLPSQHSVHMQQQIGGSSSPHRRQSRESKESRECETSPCGFRRLCVFQSIAFTVFALGNIGLNEFNQYALSKNPPWPRSWPAFCFPVFYSMWHMFFSALAAYLLACVAMPNGKDLPSFAQLWRYKHGLIPIACCTAISTWLNNWSFTLVSLFLNQAIRAMGPLPTVVLEYIIIGRNPGAPIVACVGFICIGSILSCAYRFQEAYIAPPDTSGFDDVWLGFAMVSISILLSSLRPVIAMILMSGTETHPKLDPAVVLFYDCSLAFWFMLLYWTAGPEREPSLAYLADPATRWVGVHVITVGSSMAFMYNLATYYYVNLTSAVTATIGANAVKITLIIVAAMQDNDVQDVYTWAGVALVIISIAAYAYLTIEIAAAAGAPDEDASLEKPPAVETTPLQPAPLKSPVLGPRNMSEHAMALLT
jgi:drug/metabolite transporter (DMT)-like permease